jgi:hypothetical protein
VVGVLGLAQTTFTPKRRSWKVRANSMGRNVMILSILIVAGIVNAFYSASAPAETSPKTMPVDETAFGSGIVVIYFTSSNGIQSQTDLQALSDAKLVKLGNRYFVRGKAIIVEQSKNYDKYKMLDGRDAAYDWTYVTRFYVLPRDVFKEHVKALTEKD